MEENDYGYEQKLQRENKGYNFLNIDKAKRKYKIEFLLEVSMNFKETEKELIVRHNIDTDYSSYCDDDDFETFIKALDEMCAKPYYVPRNFNRKENKLSSWDLRDILLRNKIINFADINVVVYQQAQKYLKQKYKIDDVEKVIKEMLDKQRYATKDEIKAIDKWVYLKGKIKTLKSRSRENNEYGYCRYRENTDKTITLSLTKKEYNEKLKKIENQMIKLAKSYKLFKFNKNDFDYLEILKKQSFKQFLKENREDLKDDYDGDDMGVSFDEYAKSCYEDYLEENGFDEG